MPLKQDPQGGGTETDGSLSQTYCSYCYADGAFLAPDITIAEMQAIGINALKAQGFPRPIGWLMTRGIPKLERWQN
jgi:hypothetical protein